MPFFNFKKQLTFLLKKPVLNDNQLELASVVVTTMDYLQSWPRKRPSIVNKVAYFCVLFYGNIIVAGLWGHIIILYVTAALSYNEIAIDLALVTLGTSGYQYCTSFFSHRHEAKDLLKKLGDFRRYEKPPGIEMADAVLNAIFKSVIIAEIVLTPILLWFLLSESCAEDDYGCGFLYPAYFPGLMTGYKRKFALLIQLTSAWSYVLLGTGSVWIGMHMAEYLILYIRHCQTLMKQMSLIEDFKMRKSALINVVKYHHHIIDMCDNYQEIAKGMYIVHAISTPAIMAMLIHTFIIDFQVQCLLIFAIWTMILLFVCFMGQRMINESDKLADVIYENIPLDGDMKNGKMMMLMLLRSQRPFKIPAGSLTSCDFSLFAACLKATYSYMALIQNTNTK